MKLCVAHALSGVALAIGVPSDAVEPLRRITAILSASYLEQRSPISDSVKAAAPLAVLPPFMPASCF